jgi:hypothetical protein
VSDEAPKRDNAVGIVLVTLAVLIGLVLLVKGYDNEGGVVATDTTQVKTTTTLTPVTESTLPAKAPADVQVKAVNASGAAGLATNTRTKLQAKGYTQVAIGDAPTVVPATQILYLPGSKGEAQAVAAALGLSAASVQEMPTPPPVDLGTATVLVMAGPDLV